MRVLVVALGFNCSESKPNSLEFGLLTFSNRIVAEAASFGCEEASCFRYGLLNIDYRPNSGEFGYVSS
jgi:hypothetical protein